MTGRAPDRRHRPTGVRFGPFRRGLLPALLLLIGCTLAGACKKHSPSVPGKPNILIITMDTLRADYLGCTGHPTVKTPNLDGLADSGVLFTHALAPIPLTLPSHSTIMTGRTPPFHEVRDNGTFLLSPENVTLAEVLKARGYDTAAFVSAFILDERFGLSQGFDTYDDRTDRGSLSMPVLGKDREDVGIPERRADRTTTEAMQWLDARAGRTDPFFMWVHYYDPHAAYNPPSPYREMYWGDLYAGEIAFTDEWVGKLVHKVEALGLREETIIVATADHGEGLGEHNEKTHAILIYEGTTRVPLIVSWPGGLPKGKRVDGLVSLADIMPSLLELLGTPEAGRCLGESFVGLMKGKMKGQEESAERTAYCESLFSKFHHNYCSLHAIRTQRWKYIHSNRPELFDLERDPRELVNLIDRRPDEAAAMKARLVAYLDRSASKPDAGESRFIPDDETVEKLRALGYFQAGPPPVPETDGAVGSPLLDDEAEKDLPNPRDMMAILDALQTAGNLFRMNNFEGAAAAFDRVLEGDPENIQARLQLADCHARLGNVAEAVKQCEAALAFAPGNLGARNVLAKIYFDAHRFDEAIGVLHQVLESMPRSIEARRRLGLCYWQKGDVDRAVAAFKTLLESHPRQPAALNSLGYIYIDREIDLEEGLRMIREALEVSPEDPAILDSLGWAQVKLGNYAEAVEALEKAVAGDSTNGEIYAHLAVACEKAGQPEKGAAARMRAFELGFPPADGTTTQGRPVKK